MASVIDLKRLSPGFAATLITAILIYFGTGLHPFWPLMWFAPLPVLIFASRASWRAAAAVATAAWFLGNLNLLHYYSVTIAIPPAIVMLIYASWTLMFVLAVLLFRALARRGAYWTALLSFPAFWVSFEYVLNLVSVHGTGGNIAYSQLAFLPFLQLASLTGPWGMSFLLWMFPTALALAWHLRSNRRLAYRILGVTGGILAAVLIFGAVRLALPASAEPVKVGLVSSDGPNEGVAEEGTATAALFQNYAPSVAKLAEQDAQVVVLPEKLGVAVDPDTSKVDAELQSLADQNHVRVVAGMIRVVPPSTTNPVKIRYNEARIYTPGAPVESYDKEHMLPPFESKLTPGTKLTLLAADGGSGTWGVEICKDMDFTQLSRKYGEAGAGLLLVPGWDFFSDWLEHGHMAIMRGVESGFSVVRSAKGGSLYVSDNRGRILAEVKSDSAPFATLLVTVPTAHDKTLYVVLGDWFAWVALAILGFTLLRLLMLRKASA
jgi:apolipoprotein N-acyltransferase